MIKINMFQSGFGDSLLVQVNTKSSMDTNILIDCGFNYNEILGKLKILLGETPKLDRFIITHYDADHIQGAISLIKENGSSTSPKNFNIEQVWLNSYRHLQFFEKEDSEITPIIGRRVESYLAAKTSHNKNDEGAVSALQASTLASEIFKNGYLWNSDANGKAICIENLELFSVNSEVNIQLLSPNENKLKQLEASFIRDLSKKRLKPKKGQVFDDAFELYAQSIENLADIVEGPVSANNTKIDSEMIKKLSIGGSYSKDTTKGNGSSIAFVMEFENKKVLFLGDAHAEIIIERLKSIYGDTGTIFFDAIKVSHHGSFNNNGPELYKLIDSNKFLFSTNGKHPSHKHPDLATISCIINRPLDHGIKNRKLIFNYELEHLNGFENEALKQEFNYSMIYSEEVQV
ncbi:Metallo-beta-lactamase superfamily, putative [Moritella viscosa]|uniref:MBL fold metallo-hydrolase n=1 Tax=Moritella viscosa TaxID=80854 RepID=UPI000923963F|nr:MBL fold metallo-hydrolase [Moritella viscosa]SGZ07256.1 Metallo-beta-lactamase superfamily, putative [Moritella viscosa]